jgi:hypothetical protein
VICYRSLPVNVCVLGHSDSDGGLLPAGEKSWPELLQAHLSEVTGQPAAVTRTRLVPMGSRAVGLALEHVTHCDPDLVVLAIGPYWCAFETVSTSVRNRFGERVERWYLRFERWFSRGLEGGSVVVRPKLGIRRLVRRILGTAALTTYDEVAGTYAQILRRLSQDEHLELFVLECHHFTRAIRGLNPGLMVAARRLHDDLQASVPEGRLIWADTEEAISEGGRRDEMLMDGLHMTGEGHRRVERLMERLFADHGLVGAAAFGSREAR